MNTLRCTASSFGVDDFVKARTPVVVWGLGVHNIRWLYVSELPPNPLGGWHLRELRQWKLNNETAF